MNTEMIKLWGKIYAYLCLKLWRYEIYLDEKELQEQLDYGRN